MTARTEIRLDDPKVEDFTIQGRRIWLKTDQYEVVVRVPTSVRQAYWKHGERGVIHAGSIKVSGLRATLDPLWVTICDMSWKSYTMRNS